MAQSSGYNAVPIGDLSPYAQEAVKALFADWQHQTMVCTVLQGHMGTVSTHSACGDRDQPTAARLDLNCFSFFAGTPCPELVRSSSKSALVPHDEAWCPVIEQVLGDAVLRSQRYAIKHEPDVFDRNKLQRFIDALPSEFELRRIDAEVYEQVVREKWAEDLCLSFPTPAEFARRGFGVVVVERVTNRVVAGASTYSIYDGGIEIEIDTHAAYQRRGLATVCGARMILEALERGVYPGWDAYTPVSVLLAEKLGYHRGEPYTTYFLKSSLP